MLSRQCSGGTAIPTSTPKPCKNRPGSQHAGGLGGGVWVEGSRVRIGTSGTTTEKQQRNKRSGFTTSPW